MDAVKDRVTMGACSVQEARDYVCSLACTDTPEDDDIRGLSAAIKDLMKTERGSRVCKVMSCAVLNTDFRQTQYLFKLSGKDKASISIVTNDFDRNLMADAIGC